MSDLKPCPFCGGEVKWCGGEEFEETHDCDHIICDNCEIAFICHNDQTMHACNMDSARVETAKVWNTRTETAHPEEEEK